MTITSTDTELAVDAMSSAELLAGLEGLAPPEERFESGSRMMPGASREEMKRDAIDRGDAYARLEVLIATDTTKMNRDELEAHRAAIRQAVADKGLGA